MFIVFEGGEGCGKTTLRRAVGERLEAMGYKVTYTREPGGTPLAEEIRALLLAHREERVDVMTEALLFFAARRQHVERVIKPRLSEGHIVLCDRFIDSTYALQCRGGELSRHTFNALVKTTLDDFRPDLTVVIDIDPEVSFKGVRERGELDRMEAKGLEYHQRVREGFLDQLAADPSRYYLMSGHRDLNKMVDEVINRSGL